MLHFFSKNGINIVLDVESGSVHVFEPTAYELCRLINEAFNGDNEKLTSTPESIFDMQSCPQKIKDDLISLFGFEPDEIEEAFSEIKALYNEELLFTKRDYEINLPDDYPIKALCLHISHDCNLRCKYCFAEGGDFGHGRKNMPFEVAKKAIDFVINRSGTRHNLEIDFFGGEPLINFDVVKKTVAYARSLEKQYNKNFRFTITTNGILLNDEISDYINREMSNVVLSLDGRKSVNDQVRYDVAGNGSYDRIVPKFKKLVSERNGKDYYVRGTFTPLNLDFSSDVEHIHSLGFDQISVEPVVLDSNDPLAIKEEHLDRIFEEYDLLTDKMETHRKNGNGFNFFHFMIDLEQGPCVIKRVKGCGCGTEYVAITPDGDIFPCHRFAGMDDFKLGNVLESFETKKELVDYFKQSTVLNKPVCEKCWAKYYCSGGCAANNFNCHGDILKPHEISCEMERKRIECAVYLKALEALDE